MRTSWQKSTALVLGIFACTQSPLFARWLDQEGAPESAVQPAGCVASDPKGCDEENLVCSACCASCSNLSCATTTMGCSENACPHCACSGGLLGDSSLLSGGGILGGGLGSGRLFGGIIAPSDHDFSDFVSPMTNPVFFEDPRTLTEARLIYLHHKVPLGAGGGSVNLVALQLRAAFNDWLSIIATKDGFITSSNALINDGWADVSPGLKANLWKNAARQQIISAGLTYEMPVGSTQALQGNGDGLFNMFLTGGTQIGPNAHWVSASGFLLPSNPHAESSLWFWSNHFDHRLLDLPIYALMEFNWYHYMSSGNAFTLAPIEGGDLFNFGSVGVSGNDIVTGAFGIKVKPALRSELGVAWEAPLTSRRDVLDNRITADLIVRF